MPLVGFAAEELKGFMYPAGADGGGEAAPGEAEDGGGAAGDGEGGSGSVLRAIEVTISDPRAEVRKGDVWKVGKHVLICAGVLDDWRLWTPHLDADNALFCPFPGVFVPFGSKAAQHKLVMVQPDPYIAGHILDRYAEVNGADSVGIAERKE
jgi:hypothetical protein